MSPNKIPYKFVNYNGDVLQQGSDYSGVTPQYTGETPKRELDENGHYTFTSWTPLSPLSVDNNVYTAFFTANKHLVSKTVVQKAATCTESGISTNYCTCGYSWTNVTPATGHNYITVHKDPTCTEDGYNKEVCRVDGDVKTNTVLPATGHDTENAVKGEYVASSNGENGYIPFYCQVCNAEYIAYIKTENNDTSQKSTVTLLDNDGRVTQVFEIENGEYSITVDGSNLTLTSGDKTYVFTAKNVVFRKVTGFEIDGKTLGDTINISSDISIKTLYS